MYSITLELMWEGFCLIARNSTYSIFTSKWKRVLKNKHSPQKAYSLKVAKKKKKLFTKTRPFTLITDHSSLEAYHSLLVHPLPWNTCHYSLEFAHSQSHITHCSISDKAGRRFGPTTWSNSWRTLDATLGLFIIILNPAVRVLDVVSIPATNISHTIETSWSTKRIRERNKQESK